MDDKEIKEWLKGKIPQEYFEISCRVIETYINEIPLRELKYLLSSWESHDALSHLMQWCDGVANDFQIRNVSIYSVMEIRECSYFDALHVLEAIYECEQIADFYKPDNELYYKKLISEYPIDINKFAEKLITEGIRKENIDEVTEYAKSLLRTNNPVIEPLIRKYIYHWINSETPDFSINGMSVYEVMKNMDTSYYEALIRWMNFLIKAPTRTLHSVTPGDPEFYDFNSLIK